MRSKTSKREKSPPQYQNLNGRRVVVLDEGEYERLKQKADEWEPLLPPPDKDGNYPAVEYARASLARKIIRHRRQLGLTLVDLARRAGIRPETLTRIEGGKHTASVATIDKIDRALTKAEAEVSNSHSTKAR